MDNEKLNILNKIEELKNFEVSYYDYDDFIDEVNERVRVGCSEFSPSEVLKNCDPVAYDVGKDDYEDEARQSLYEDIEHEIENSDLTEEEKDFLTREFMYYL